MLLIKLEINEIDGVPVTGIPDGSRTVKGALYNYRVPNPF